MTTSGSSNFIVTAKDIITEALEQLGVLGEGEEASDNQIRSSLRTLNMMTKTWQANGLNLFAVQELFLFLKQNQLSYRLDSSTPDNVTTSFTETTVSTAAMATDTSITLAEAGTVANGDFIGILLSSGEVLHWSTVTDASMAPTVVIADALPEDVNAGATVYYYTTKASRPMKVLEAYTHRFGGVDVPCAVIGRVDYGELANKEAQGVTNQVYFETQVGTATLFVWPVTSTERDYLRFYVQKTLDDFDCIQNTPDYPQEWYLPLAFGLAVLLAPKYGIPQTSFNRIARIAADMYTAAEGFDEENETSLYFRPDTWGRDVARTGA